MSKKSNLTHVMNDESEPVLQVTPESVCDHCGNSGMVLLDGVDADGYELGGMPCPSCELGELINTKTYDGVYTSLMNDPKVTFNGGLSINVRKCYSCAGWFAGGVREHYVVCAGKSATSVPPASLRFLVDAVKQSQPSA